MKHLLLPLLLLLISINSMAAKGIQFEENMSWADIKAKAIKEQKMIFLDAYTSWCGPCKFLETKIYTDDSVADYYNKNFINVKFDMEKGEGIELAKEFDIITFPTLLFFTPEGKLIHKNVGALRAEEFISLGKDAANPDKQYFTLKQKVVDKQASNDDFLKWTKMADEMQDLSRGAVAADWLSTKEDILANEELTKATMLYTDVTEEQMAYLYQQKDRIQQLLKWDAAKTDNKLYQKLFVLALKGVDKETGSTAGFSSVIKKFEPSKLNYALRNLKVLTALNKENDQAKAMQLISSSLKGKDRLSLREVASLLFDHVPRFDEDAIRQLKTALAAYRFTIADQGQESWLYLMQVVCHSRLGENTAAKALAQKASQKNILPMEYQDFLKESFGLAR